MSRLPGPETVALRPFAPEPASAVQGLEVRVARPEPTRLLLEYELRADLARLSIPGPASSLQATEGLWRHTCMELFVAAPGAAGYLEFNLAPSGQWAAYRFSGYRSGMSPLAVTDPPRIELRTRPERLLLSAQLRIPEDLAAGALRLGLSAVIESEPGQLAYWALRHPGERPDFHHPDSFGFEI